MTAERSASCRPDKFAPAISTRICGADLQPERHFPLLARYGFLTIEVMGHCHGDHVYMDRGRRKRLRKVADEHGINIRTVHPRISHALSSPQEEEQEAEMEFLLRAAESAAELGAQGLVIHAGQKIPPLGSDERRASEDRIKGNLDKLAARAKGIPVKFCLETVTGKDVDLSNEQILQLVLDLPAAAFAFCLDTGHSFIAGDLYGMAQKAGPRLLSLHLHDCNGIIDDHDLPYNGGINWRRFMAYLVASNYAGPLLFEALTGGEMDDMLARCRGAYQRLLRERETLSL